MTLTASQLAQFALGAVLIVLLPGPNSLFVATTAAQVGRRAGFKAACGVFLGDAILMVLAVLGAGSVLASGSIFFTLLRIVGGGYLAWLGIGLIRRGIQFFRVASTSTKPTSATLTDARYAPFRRALLTCLLNPKAILFFAAFFVQFIKPGDPHLWDNFAALAVVLQIVSFVYLTTVITIASRMAGRNTSNPRRAAWGYIATGSAFCLFALKILFS